MKMQRVASLLIGVMGALFFVLTVSTSGGATPHSMAEHQLYLPLISTPFFPISPGEMVHVPAGEFQMGCDTNNPAFCKEDEQPLHTVYLDAFNIDKYEVTNNQYASFLNSRNSNDCNGMECIDLDDSNSRIDYQNGQYVVASGYGDHPVTWVTWFGAEAYCTENGRRLPTEAEWEKAARGSSDTRMFPWGNTPADCTLANAAPDNVCVGDTSRVGSYPAGVSPYGALDMAGNVGEWTNDWYDSGYYSVSPHSNPQGPATGTYKVLRGGGLNAFWSLIRVASRDNNYLLYAYFHVGFRCVAFPGE